jgi:transcriptional regulator with XRE-family HTH domain
MFNLSLFAERLNELIFDNKTNAIEVSKAIGVSKSAIYRYLKSERIPSVDLLVKLSNYFNCSINFIIGLDSDNYTKNHLICPPFYERFRFLLDKFKVTKYKLVKDTHIPESIVYTWQNGQCVPTIESIMKLAEYFNCSVDYIVGREN